MHTIDIPPNGCDTTKQLVRFAWISLQQCLGVPLQAAHFKLVWNPLDALVCNSYKAVEQLVSEIGWLSGHISSGSSHHA